ncbi:unnamed protein product [Amoebophrya sp. A120]|nr:unnamed protein product [Amoebophrya sp. A120]|eukprot:GSA120T00015125001.1
MARRSTSTTSLCASTARRPGAGRSRSERRRTCISACTLHDILNEICAGPAALQQAHYQRKGTVAWELDKHLRLAQKSTRKLLQLAQQEDPEALLLLRPSKNSDTGDDADWSMTTINATATYLSFPSGQPMHETRRTGRTKEKLAKTTRQSPSASTSHRSMITALRTSSSTHFCNHGAKKLDSGAKKNDAETAEGDVEEDFQGSVSSTNLSSATSLIQVLRRAKLTSSRTTRPAEATTSFAPRQVLQELQHRVEKLRRAYDDVRRVVLAEKKDNLRRNAAAKSKTIYVEYLSPEEIKELVPRCAKHNITVKAFAKELGFDAQRGQLSAFLSAMYPGGGSKSLRVPGQSLDITTGFRAAVLMAAHCKHVDLYEMAPSRKAANDRKLQYQYFKAHCCTAEELEWIEAAVKKSQSLKLLLTEGEVRRRKIERAKGRVEQEVEMSDLLSTTDEGHNYAGTNKDYAQPQQNKAKSDCSPGPMSMCADTSEDEETENKASRSNEESQSFLLRKIIATLVEARENETDEVLDDECGVFKEADVSLDDSSRATSSRSAVKGARQYAEEFSLESDEKKDYAGGRRPCPGRVAMGELLQEIENKDPEPWGQGALRTFSDWHVLYRAEHDFYRRTAITPAAESFETGKVQLPGLANLDCEGGELK